MTDISFSVTAEDGDLIQAIVERAMQLGSPRHPNGGSYKMTLTMDITACHANGCPLRLQSLLDADDFNFAHDVFGISQHMDRTTGQLDGRFLPRFAAPKEATQ